MKSKLTSNKCENFEKLYTNYGCINKHFIFIEYGSNNYIQIIIIATTTLLQNAHLVLINMAPHELCSYVESTSWMWGI